MSLNTVIKIGELYRQSENSWQYHDQVNWAMNDVNSLSKKKDKNDSNIETVFYEMPVVRNGNKFKFQFSELKELKDEDKKNSIFYLNFKTSKKDAEKRYLLGDIVYSAFTNKKGDFEENGNYRMPKDKKASSFFRCEEASKTMDDDFIQQFRNTFRENAAAIENILKSHNSVVLHFNFDGKRWLEFEGIIESIDGILTNSLVVDSPFENKVSLDKYLYKTLGGVTPGFGEDVRYKNRIFTRDEVVSLMYAGKATEKPIIRINGIGIIALPHSEKLTTKDVVAFFEREKDISKDEQLDEEGKKEERIAEKEDEESDSIFGVLVDNDFNDKVKFDIIFTSIPGSPAGVFYDLIEISNVEKSLLVKIKEQILNAKTIVSSQALKENPNLTHSPYLDIRNSFLKILGDVTKDKKKFQLHLLRILPKIYTDTYYNDPVLLPAFIEKVEYNIRNGEKRINYSTLKYDFYFLLKIQKIDTLMQITESQSYALGKALGTMAKPFAAWRDDCPIKSFEKSYVGNLTRRISSLAEIAKFSDFLNQKLTIHEKAYRSEKEAFLELIKTIKAFEKERYNKHYCSLGFFESYYSFNQKENNHSQTENQE